MMNILMKIVLAVAIAMTPLCGCKNEKGKVDGGYYPENTNSVMQAGFNEETYIWENFIFSTNMVEKAR